MLGTLTLETATPLVGTTFRVTTADGGSVEVKLADAVAFPAPQQRRSERNAGAPRRRPFSLYFIGPPQPILPQACYRFESDALTFDTLFIVPLGADAEGVEYEAVFT